MSKGTEYTKKIRLLDYIKRLQGSSPVQQQNSDFEISSTQQDEDFRELKSGFEFMGWTIRLKGLKGRKRYGDTNDLNDSTLHPMFFCLNLTELLALIGSIKESSYPVSKDLMKMIFKQLSEYGKSKAIERYPELSQFRDTDWRLRSRQESDIYTISNLMNFYLKPGRSVIVTKNSGEKVIGKVHPEMTSDLIIIKVDESKTERVQVSEIVDISPVI